MEIRVWIGYGYELFTTMIPAIALLFIFRSVYKRRRVSTNPRYAAYILIFSFYLFGVFHFTGAGTFFDIMRYGLELKASQMNFVPFSDTDIDSVAYVLNIILFIPLGFLLSFIWPRFRKVKYIFFAGILFSALIEISQLLNNRATDIDDLILNTAGAVLGTIFFHLFSHFTNRRPATNGNYKYEAYVYILFIFLCRFFLYDEFGMAKKLYEF